MYFQCQFMRTLLIFQYTIIETIKTIFKFNKISELKNITVAQLSL